MTLSSPKQYSDLEPFKMTVTGVVNGQLPAQSVTFRVGTQTVGTAPMMIVGANAEANLDCAVARADTIRDGADRANASDSAWAHRDGHA